MFIVGIRSDLNIRPGRLRPHSPPTVRQTIGGLPSLRSSLSKGGDSVERWRDEIAKLSPLEIGRQLNGSIFTRDIVRGIESQTKAGSDGPKTEATTASMGAMAKGLERDPQVDSLLRNRKIELGLRSSGSGGIGHQLYEHLGLGRDRALGIGM